MRLYGKLVIVPNKSDGLGNCITPRFVDGFERSGTSMQILSHPPPQPPQPPPLRGCLLMFAVHVNACTSALILHCNVTLPIFSRFCPFSLWQLRARRSYIAAPIISPIRPRNYNEMIIRLEHSPARPLGESRRYFWERFGAINNNASEYTHTHTHAYYGNATRINERELSCFLSVRIKTGR